MTLLEGDYAQLVHQRYHLTYSRIYTKRYDAL
jgi:hypothetical protein